VNGGIKGPALAISLVAALAVSGTPAGATTQSVDSEAAAAAKGAQLRIRMVVVTQGSVPVAVKRFRFRGLLVRCNGGATIPIRGKISRMDVNNSRFRHTIRRPGKRVHVEGRFRQGGSVVRGQIRARGNFGAQHGCNSGVVRWVAR
jgi:hypothetical protein